MYKPKYWSMSKIVGIRDDSATLSGGGRLTLEIRV